MKEKIIALKQERAKLFEDMKAVMDKADSEKRSMSSDEDTKFRAMESDFDSKTKTIETLERHEARATQLAGSSAPNPLIGGKEGDGTGVETDVRSSKKYEDAFFGFLKHQRLGDLKAEFRDLYKGSDAKGGALVPTLFEKTLMNNLVNFNVLREIATVTTASNDTKIPFVASEGAADWLDEKGTYGETDDEFGSVLLEAWKVGRIIKISEELLFDSAFNLAAEIQKSFAKSVGLAQEVAYISGNGTKKPTGFLTNATVGVTSASNAGITSDELMDLFHALHRNFRMGATWLFNDSTAKIIRKLKDSTGQYMWQPGLVAGQPDMLLGKPVKIAELPNIDAVGAPQSKPVAFGDFSNYRIVDRTGIQFQALTELYAATGQVGYRVYMRTDGKLLDAKAVQVLKMKA